MQPAHALAFDFNGTLSHDEPVLFAIYAELFAEHGRPLTEADYYGRLAGNTEEAIIQGWLDVDRVDDPVRRRQAVVGERPAHREAAKSGGAGRGDPRLGVLECDDVGRPEVVAGTMLSSR